jgi:hypothetical protein
MSFMQISFKGTCWAKDLELKWCARMVLSSRWFFGHGYLRRRRHLPDEPFERLRYHRASKGEGTGTSVGAIVQSSDDAIIAKDPNGIILLETGAEESTTIPPMRHWSSCVLAVPPDMMTICQHHGCPQAGGTVSTTLPGGSARTAHGSQYRSLCHPSGCKETLWSIIHSPRYYYADA